jgi:hypothetical protein
MDGRDHCYLDIDKVPVCKLNEVGGCDNLKCI